MFRCLATLSFLLLTGALARAQVIADPARALAARDTLLRQAEQLRQQVQQTSPRLATNALGRPRRRTQVSGFTARGGRRPAARPGEAPLGAARPVLIFWSQQTRYHRNGRVQERFYATVNNRVLFDERRLNGRVVWLVVSQAPGPGRVAARHRGLLLAGYVALDGQQYALPAAP
ncbi:hypothetical protein ACFQ48_12135 [Hymenobacter caeli]|uniref:Uncharacterized protein n=1 Tax=Hymenobacter caeli TaxID=2735894 RepID=A0ABX2FMP3_9BACT|nr:hypothetical protein [Hymenobacter caeli]NRT18433.1 hypothetical protein [Hymenobacter caeli]